METAKLIMENSNPKVAKELGRKVRNFDSEKWLIAAYPIMVAVNFAKYSRTLVPRSKHCKNLLLSTGDKIIVEASPYDKIWGIGLHWEDDDCLDENKWWGMNLLGGALMEVRKTLRNENSIT